MQREDIFMEQKCLKTSVYFNDTVFNDSLEQAIDVDFSLPDFCPDISKIFKCQAEPRIASKSINGRTITIEGVVQITLIYCDKNGKLCSYEYQYPFSKSCEMQQECQNANICCKARKEYINCRAVTGRKVDIHGAISISVKVFKRKCCDIVSDFDDEAVELKRGIANATVPMGYAEKYLLIEDEIRIGQSQPPVCNILRYEANTCVKETKVINDKAVVKGEMSVSIIYCAENIAQPQCVKSIIPFSQIVDVEGITDTCKCDTKSSVCSLEIKPRVSSTGEAKSFSINAKVLLSCEGYCSNEVAVILDAYSRKYKAEIKKNNINFERITHNICENFNCKKSIELENDIVSVVDIWSNVQSANCKFEEDHMAIYGTLMVGMIVCDENDTSVFYEKPIDFEFKCPLKLELGVPHCEPKLEIISCSYTITSSNCIEVRVEIATNTAVYERKNIGLISDMMLDENAPLERNRREALKIYFAEENDNVWDIARDNNASVDEIMQINGLSEDTFKSRKMILIPII